jgi:hypothetical protein
MRSLQRSTRVGGYVKGAGVRDAAENAADGLYAREAETRRGA